MCNSLHIDSKPIPEEGVGWKLFSYQHDNFKGLGSDKIKLSSLVYCLYYKDLVNSFVTWRSRFSDGGDGFCFFLKNMLIFSSLFYTNL